MAALCGASWLWAAEPQLEKTDAAPPESVSAEIREALSPKALQVVTDGKSLADFWLRPEVPVTEAATAELGVGFGHLRQCTLLGVVRLSEAWSDYKDKPIPAGVYTLRYAIQPADG
ncbi:MAG: hypothetical protein V3R89_06670, partial [Thermoanaerobaculia bacterium]